MSTWCTISLNVRENELLEEIISGKKSSGTYFLDTLRDLICGLTKTFRLTNSHKLFQPMSIILSYSVRLKQEILFFKNVNIQIEAILLYFVAFCQNTLKIELMRKI